MLFSLLPIFLIVFTAILTSSSFDIKFSFTSLIAVFSIIIVLYFSYIFDCLRTGRIIVIALCFALCLLLLSKMFTNKCMAQNLYREIRSPIFISFLFFLAFSWFISRDLIVQHWDALRLWGAYPKALYSTSELQLGEDALLFDIMKSYPPGMPLFCYFIASFCPVFDERVLFFAYDFFLVVLLLPLYELVYAKFRTKFIQSIFVVLFSICLLWCLFSTNLDYARFFNSLFIDPILGICSGCCFFLCFYQRDIDPISIATSALSCACLALLKDSGAFIGLSAILGGFIGSLVSKQREQLRYILLRLGVELFALASVWVSWSYLLDLYSITNHIQMSFVLFDSHSLSLLLQQIISEPILEINFLSFSIPFSLLICFTIYCIIKTALIFCRKMDMRAEIVFAVSELSCYILFFLGYCLSFSSYLSEGRYPSYVRYFSTLVVSSTYLLAGSLLYNTYNLPKHLHAFFSRYFRKSPSFRRSVFFRPCLLLIDLIVVYSFLSIYPDIKNPFSFLSYENYIESQEFVSLTKQVVSPKTETTDVYLVIPGDISILHHRIYFDFLDKNIRVVNFYNEANISSEGCNYSPSSFISELISKSIEYVLVTELDEIHYNEFRSILGNASVGDLNLIFHVDKATQSLVRIA